MSELRIALNSSASDNLDGVTEAAWLALALQHLRWLLQRRVCWLRQQWRHDPLQNYQAMVISEAQADWLLAGEDPAREARFYGEDPEAARLSEALAEAETGLSLLGEALEAAGTPPPLAVLARLFGLTPFEREVLLLCLAPELDAAFERLYAYVQDDVTRNYATPQLALALHGGTDETRLAARESFAPAAPLRRFRLLRFEAASGTHASLRPLRLTERVTEFLLGVNRLDEQVAALLQPLPPVLIAPAREPLLAQLERWVQQTARAARPLILNLYGQPGAGKLALAHALGERLGMRPGKLNLARLLTASDRTTLIGLLEREAVLLQLALCVDATELDADKTAHAGVEELLERFGGLLIVCSSEPWPSEQPFLALNVAKPPAAEQLELWRQALNGAFDGRLEALVQQFDFGPTAIWRTVERAAEQARLRAREVALTETDLWQACRAQASWQLDELAQRIIPCHQWEDLILPADQLLQLRELAAQVAHRAQVYERWGFGVKLSRGRGLAALFAGASGTGKTLAAEVLAQQLQLDLYRIDLAGIVSKYIGETEKNLRRVFDAAEQSGAILFFDEADALFGKRSEVKDSHDRYANIEINYLLQRMEDYRGLAVLATNMKAHLDQAFLRRLRFIIDFPAPDAALRALIWRGVFPSQAEVEGLDYERLARLELTGGSIKNIAVNAAFLAADAGAPIRLEHVMWAARREYAKIEKLMSEAEFGAYYVKGMK